MLEPMGGVGEGEEFGVRAIAQTFVSHFGQKEIVALAPEDAGVDADGFVREFDASAEEGAVPVDHGGESAGPRPCGAVLGGIFGGEGTRATGAEKRGGADAEMGNGKKDFREPRE